MKRKLLLMCSLVIIGFYTYAQQTIYVKANATGANNGTSWADAYTNFQTAVNAATSGDKVWVASGTYQPASNQSFSMKEGVKIYGGFKNIGNPTMNDRNWITNITILKGNGRSVISNNNNSLTTAAVLDGFTITGGGNLSVGGNNDDFKGGGGIYNNASSPSLTNLTISGNTAGNFYGGGILNNGSSPSIINVKICGNDRGAGIENMASSSPTLINVIISGNSAAYGGGICNWTSSSATLINVTISGNSAYHNGGGICNFSSTSVTLYNTIVLGNNSGIYGEGIVTGNSSHNLIQTGNATSGGVYNGSPLANTTPAEVFVNPLSPGLNTGGDYSLKYLGSNIGNNSFNNTSTDVANNPRINTGIIDLGAYEYQMVHRYYVDAANVSGLHNGKSWATAFNKLEDGLNAAKGYYDDTVFVAKGTYQPSLFQMSFGSTEGQKIFGGFQGNESSLSERNLNASGDTSILLGNGCYVFYSRGGYLDGFKITGGTACASGGGIYIEENRSPTFTNVMISGNTAARGSGVYMEQNTSPTFTNVTISGNTSSTYDAGGGVYIENNSSPTFTNVTISGNSAGGGGGICIRTNATPTFTNVTISGNTANGYDLAHSLGGGIYLEGGANPTFTNVTISGNSAGSGGGIYNMGTGSLTNVIINGNTASANGGGLYNKHSNPTLTNVTISGNKANEGGGMYVDDYWEIMNPNDFKPTLYNSIILGNNSGIGRSIYWDTTTIGSSSSKNLIQTGDETTGGNFDGVAAANSTPSDIFIDAKAPAQTTLGDYRLKVGAYVINKGDNSKNSKPSDLVGVDRTVGGTIDLGAYEYQNIVAGNNNIIYVKQGAAGDGSSWGYATGDFQGAINAAGVQQVWVAAGTYQPTINQYFSMKEGIKIYGGFAGTETQLNQRNWKSNITTLKGNNNSVIRNVSNNLTANAVLDGFVITDANSNDNGGGIFNKDVSPSYANLIIHNNYALHGGGMFNENASPTLIDVLISGNRVYGNGGGMYNISSSPMLTNVTISGNTADLNGASVFNYNSSSPKLYNCIVLGNNLGIGGNSNIDGSSSKNLIQTGNNGSEGAFDGNVVSGATASNIFVDSKTPQKTIGGNYNLKAIIAAAVDKGDETKFTGLNVNSQDLAGNVRVYNYGNGGKIDLGAYEYQGFVIHSDNNNIIYVKQNATGDGSSWGCATGNFQGAINAIGVQQVWVSSGTYQPASEQYFSMKEGVKVYGGFTGTETQLSQRNWNTNATVLKGNYNSVIRNISNNLTTNAVLDGFVITDAISNDNGGGIYNKDVSPSFANLIIRNNYGAHGGGMFNDNASPTLIDVLISGNAVNGNGGGMHNLNTSSPTLINVTISSNAAPGSGGGFLIIIHLLQSFIIVLYWEIIWELMVL